MSEIKRQSPVQFKVSPTKSEVRDNWTVALEYDDEGRGPWLVDLAHKTRWDLQDSQVGEQTPCELAVPAVPGACTFANDTLVNRMNRTQASIYHLGTEHRACLIFQDIRMSPSPPFSWPCSAPTHFPLLKS
jgi:hypothetical protein